MRSSSVFAVRLRRLEGMKSCRFTNLSERGWQTVGFHRDPSLLVIELGFNVVRDPMHVHDLNASILHLLGFDHTRLTYRFQGQDSRLADVHGEAVRGILA